MEVREKKGKGREMRSYRFQNGKINQIQIKATYHKPADFILSSMTVAADLLLYIKLRRGASLLEPCTLICWYPAKYNG